MLEGAFMEYAKWIIGLFSAAAMLTVVIFLFQLNSMNTFQQEVNYQIERHGGLTPEAMYELNAYAKSNYGGCITISYEDSGTCYFEADKELPTSGIYVREYVNTDSGFEYYTRPSGELEPYGSDIKYILSRHIGSSAEISVMKPVVYGEGVSRVRGL